MLANLLLSIALISASPPPVTPNDAWGVGFLHLQGQTAPADQPYTRFLSLHNKTDAERAVLTRVENYACNSTSFRSEFGKVEPVAGGLLLKLDLRSFGWDYPSRVKRLAELERRGVKFNFKDDKERAAFLNPWEALAALDPYFFTDPNYFHAYYPNAAYEGWIDPYAERDARVLSHSAKFLLRADWVIGKLLLEKQFGGIYSDLLMFPAKEADLYRSFLIDINAVNRDNALRQGGSVLESIVALHNRELQLIPSPYGQGGNRFLWQTLDVRVDARGDKSVLEALAGTMKHDGRETILSLPNGLLGYLLYDGAGKQAAVVPEDIAQIKNAKAPVRDTRVINSYACLKCHGPVNGTYPFDDVVGKLLDHPASKVDQYGYHDAEAALRDYYSSSLGETIRVQQEAYAKRLKEACGMTGGEAALAVTEAVEVYLHELVTPEAAAAEMGYDLAAANLYWLAGKNPQLLALATGTPIRRAGWEGSFKDAMAIPTYRWELAKPKPALQPPPQPQAQPYVPPAYHP